MTFQASESDSLIRRLRVELAPSSVMIVVLVGIGLWILSKLLPVVLVLIVALFIAGTMTPLVAWLEEKKIPRTWGITLVFLGLFITLGLILTLTIPPLINQVDSLVEQEPVLRAQLVTFLERFRSTTAAADALRNVHYDPMTTVEVATAVKFSTRIVEVLTYSASAIFLAMYMMFDRDRLRGGLFALLPRSHHLRLSRVMLNLELIVGGYIRGQLLTSVLMAIFVFILLTACGIPNAIAIAVFAGIVDVLPYIGVFLSIAPTVIAALPQGWVITGIVLVSMIIYEEIESRFLVPRIYGHTLRLPSSVVLFSLLVGGTLLGIIGALLALPIAAAILMLIDELRIDLPGEAPQLGDVELRTVDEQNEQEYQRRAEGKPAQEASTIAVEITEDRKKEEGQC